MAEIKIRLADPLHRQLTAEASRNGRPLTAEIRARLEASCVIDHERRSLDARLDRIEARLNRKSGHRTDTILDMMHMLLDEFPDDFCRAFREVAEGSIPDEVLDDIRGDTPKPKLVR